jgi:hypothetical protein
LGGAVAVDTLASVTISLSSFTSARGKVGGAFHFVNVGSVVISSSQFSNNSALNGSGGAWFFGENTGFNIQGFFFFCFGLCYIY